MDRKTPSPYDTATAAPHAVPNAVEKRRRPDGPVTPGESHGKRTNEERNDPDVEPGAASGQPRDQAVAVAPPPASTAKD